MRPSLQDLRSVAQPPTVVGRASGEHWTGRLYMRPMSIRLTRLLIPTGVSANAITASMLVTGPAAAAALAVPHLWGAIVAFLVIQLQGLLDCSDGELARWRGTTGPVGIYLDRIGHYVTDGCLAVAVGVRADGGFGSIDGWTMVGIATGFLVLITKAETDLVHVARAQSGRPRVEDTVAAARPRPGLLRILRSLVVAVPFNRALLAIEMTGLAVIVAIIDFSRGSLDAARFFDVALLAIAIIVVVGHLVSTIASDRLR
jgi:phosphatidylglycerophosphate synthase